MSETAKHVSITLTFKTDTEPGLVFAQLMEMIGEKQVFVVDSKVRLFEIAEDQPFPDTEAAAQEAANILGNALFHPVTSNCWGRIASADSECGVCRARAILLAALDQPAKGEA